MPEPTVRDYLGDMLEKYRRLQPPFRRVFGILLKPYWNNFTGFDVIEFDDFIKPKKNESTCEAIERKFGPRG